jgi:putative thioredoxin
LTKDVSEADFMAEVVERSRELPVVVDFWAEWCGPCRQLGPALEAAVAKRAGKVELAKVDVDSNQALSRSFGIQGIPAVKAFRDGQVVAEFTGAIPPAQIERWLDTLVPSPADELAAAGDEASLRDALELDPRHSDAAAGLAKVLLARDEPAEALAVVEPLAGDFRAQGLAARARLTLEAEDGELDPPLAKAFAAWDSEDFEQTLEGLQEAITAAADPGHRDLIREAMVGIFAELGADHELARTHRRRLAAALN